MYSDAGMNKLIVSSAYGDEVGLGVRFMDAPGVMTKTAETVFGRGYADLKAPRGHIGLHMTALGDWEHWGANRNFDTFPKAACVKYHDTFVKHAKVYRNHRHTADVLGVVKASAYNEPMGRIELFLHVDEDAAAPELNRMAKEGESRHSMGCRVPGDRCTKCGTFRKNAKDPRMCSHVRDQLGHTLSSGEVIATHNDDPDYYDISFISNKQADRTAYDLKVAGLVGELPDSVTLAELAGLVPTAEVMAGTQVGERLALIGKLAVEQRRIRALSKSAHAGERFYAKTAALEAGERLTEEDVDTLREYEPARLLAKLAGAAVILPAADFYAYALGGCKSAEYTGTAPRALTVIRAGVFDVLERYNKQAAYAAASNSYFAVDCGIAKAYSTTIDGALQPQINKLSFNESIVRTRTMDKLAHARLSEPTPLGDLRGYVSDVAAEHVAATYAAYKLAALQRIITNHPEPDVLIALAAAQDLFT